MTYKNAATTIALALAITVTFLPASSYLPGDTATVIPDQIGGTALATHGSMSCWDADAALNSAEWNLYWIIGVCSRPEAPPMCGIMIAEAERQIIDATLAWLHACGF